MKAIYIQNMIIVSSESEGERSTSLLDVLNSLSTIVTIQSSNLSLIPLAFFAASKPSTGKVISNRVFFSFDQYFGLPAKDSPTSVRFCIFSNDKKGSSDSMFASSAAVPLESLISPKKIVKIPMQLHDARLSQCIGMDSKAEDTTGPSNSQAKKPNTASCSLAVRFVDLDSSIRVQQQDICVSSVQILKPILSLESTIENSSLVTKGEKHKVNSKVEFVDKLFSIVLSSWKWGSCHFPFSTILAQPQESNSSPRRESISDSAELFYPSSIFKNLYLGAPYEEVRGRLRLGMIPTSCKFVMGRELDEACQSAIADVPLPPQTDTPFSTASEAAAANEGCLMTCIGELRIVVWLGRSLVTNYPCYVKCCMNERTHITEPNINSKNPVWDAAVVFRLFDFDLTSDVKFEIWEAHMLRQDRPIGQVVIPIAWLCERSRDISSENGSYSVSQLSSFYEVLPINEGSGFNRGGQYRANISGSGWKPGFGLPGNASEGFLQKQERMRTEFSSRTWSDFANHEHDPNTREGTATEPECLGYLKISVEMCLIRPPSFILADPRLNIKGLLYEKAKLEMLDTISFPHIKYNMDRVVRMMKSPSWLSVVHDIITWQYSPKLTVSVMLFLAYVCFIAPPWQLPVIFASVIVLLGYASSLRRSFGHVVAYHGDFEHFKNLDKMEEMMRTKKQAEKELKKLRDEEMVKKARIAMNDLNPVLHNDAENKQLADSSSESSDDDLENPFGVNTFNDEVDENRVVESVKKQKDKAKSTLTKPVIIAKNQDGHNEASDDEDSESKKESWQDKFNRYKAVTLKVQTISSKIASVLERVANVLTWADPQVSSVACTTLFIVSVLFSAVLYVIPINFIIYYLLLILFSPEELNCEISFWIVYCTENKKQVKRALEWRLINFAKCVPFLKNKLEGSSEVLLPLAEEVKSKEDKVKAVAVIKESKDACMRMEVCSPHWPDRVCDPGTASLQFFSRMIWASTIASSGVDLEKALYYLNISSLILSEFDQLSIRVDDWLGRVQPIECDGWLAKRGEAGLKLLRSTSDSSIPQDTSRFKLRYMELCASVDPRLFEALNFFHDKASKDVKGSRLQANEVDRFWTDNGWKGIGTQNSSKLVRVRGASIFLSYYDSTTACLEKLKPLGVIDMCDVVEIRDCSETDAKDGVTQSDSQSTSKSGTQPLAAFQIVTPYRIYVFAADSKYNKIKWIRKLRSAVHLSLELEGIFDAFQSRFSSHNSGNEATGDVCADAALIADQLDRDSSSFSIVDMEELDFEEEKSELPEARERKAFSRASELSLSSVASMAHSAISQSAILNRVAGKFRKHLDSNASRTTSESFSNVSQSKNPTGPSSTENLNKGMFKARQNSEGRRFQQSWEARVVELCVNPPRIRLRSIDGGRKKSNEADEDSITEIPLANCSVEDHGSLRARIVTLIRPGQSSDSSEGSKFVLQTYYLFAITWGRTSAEHSCVLDPMHELPEGFCSQCVTSRLFLALPQQEEKDMWMEALLSIRLGKLLKSLIQIEEEEKMDSTPSYIRNIKTWLDYGKNDKPATAPSDQVFQHRQAKSIRNNRLINVAEKKLAGFSPIKIMKYFLKVIYFCLKEFLRRIPDDLDLEHRYICSIARVDPEDDVKQQTRKSRRIPPRLAPQPLAVHATNNLENENRLLVMEYRAAKPMKSFKCSRQAIMVSNIDLVASFVGKDWESHSRYISNSLNVSIVVISADNLPHVSSLSSAVSSIIGRNIDSEMNKQMTALSKQSDSNIGLKVGSLASSIFRLYVEVYVVPSPTDENIMILTNLPDKPTQRRLLMDMQKSFDAVHFQTSHQTACAAPIWREEIEIEGISLIAPRSVMESMEEVTSHDSCALLADYLSGIVVFEIYFEDGIQTRQMIGQSRVALSDVAARGGEVNGSFAVSSSEPTSEFATSPGTPALNVKLCLYNYFK